MLNTGFRINSCLSRWPIRTLLLIDHRMHFFTFWISFACRNNRQDAHPKADRQKSHSSIISSAITVKGGHSSRLNCCGNQSLEKLVIFDMINHHEGIQSKHKMFIMRNKGKNLLLQVIASCLSEIGVFLCLWPDLAENTRSLPSVDGRFSKKSHEYLFNAYLSPKGQVYY